MPFRLFEVYGVEIEYMVVDAETLAVRPDVDRLLTALGGSPDSHPSFGGVEADNELAAHVLELKAMKPDADLAALARDFQGLVKKANAALKPMGAMLLGTGMHPFMDPKKESRIWSHEDNEIYHAYDRIFGVRGHGWFNLQSVHLNLPFANDAEFAALHNAISLLLPLLPALAASTPFCEGRRGGSAEETPSGAAGAARSPEAGRPNAEPAEPADPWLDTRLFHYCQNQRRLPAIIGPIVPEPVGSEEEYRERILAPMYREIAPHDPEGLLQDEWLNSRAAIARFDRNAIEIRCLDTQEAPAADLALCWFVTEVLKKWLEPGSGGGSAGKGGGSGADLLALHRRVRPGLLGEFFRDTARLGMDAPVPEGYPAEALLARLHPEKGGARIGNPARTAGHLLQSLFEGVAQGKGRAGAGDSQREDAGATLFRPLLETLLRRGNLSRRLLASGLPLPDRYRALARCLERGELFL